MSYAKKESLYGQLLSVQLGCGDCTVGSDVLCSQAL